MVLGLLWKLNCELCGGRGLLWNFSAKCWQVSPEISLEMNFQHWPLSATSRLPRSRLYHTVRKIKSFVLVPQRRGPPYRCCTPFALRRSRSCRVKTSLLTRSIPEHRKLSLGLEVWKINSLNILFWWLVAEVIPDPIPNSAVKLRWGDDTGNGKVASRQNKIFKFFQTSNPRLFSCRFDTLCGWAWDWDPRARLIENFCELAKQKIQWVDSSCKESR